MLEIKKFKDPILRSKCVEVELTDEVRDLISDMKETMYKAEGIGLAAPQVGKNFRIFIADIGEGCFVFINPKIISKKGSVLSDEGCLSLPGIFGKVKRAKEIKVEALNEEGQRFEAEVSGLFANCIQHEIDHLNGILFTDRLRAIDKIKDKLNKCLKK
jgi:peptide deformylase